MTVEFFPNKVADSAPLAVFKTDRRMTLEEWLISQAPSYKRRESAPISIALNDEIIEPRLWHKVKFKPSDSVQIWREPKGTDPFSMAVLLVAGAKAVSKFLTPKMPGTPSTAGTEQGSPLDEASAKGNKVKLGDTIRHVAGFQRVFPSYLAEPRTYFADPREQWVEMLLYVSDGDCAVPLNRMKVGETPIISLGSDAVVQVYPPGSDVSGETASMLWFNVAEVGASSSGAAGLELTVATSLTPSATASAYQFNDDAISIPAGNGSFPADWEAGLVIRVLSPYVYTVVDGGAGRDIVQGPLEMLNPFPGQVIEIAGANAGNYVVHTFTPYAPAVPPSSGTASTILGSSIPSRYDFDVTPLSVTVTLGATPYVVNLTTDAVDLAGLVSAFNTAKGSAPFLASASGGLLLITQFGTFGGETMVSSGGADILGSSPINTTGTAATSGTPEVPAQMTLNYDGGAPVAGLALGPDFAAIGPRGLRYRITAFAPSIMTVERLTSSGAVDTGWPGFDVMETVGGLVTLDASNLEGGYRGPFAAGPENELITHIEYSIQFPSGIIGLGKTGGWEYEITSTHHFEYRDMDIAGAWTVLPQTVSGASRDTMGFTFRHTLPYPMKAECRIKRMPKGGGGNSSEWNDNVNWYGLRGLRQTRPASYPGMTIMSVKVRGGDRLSAQSESQVSVEATRKLPVRSGGAWLPAQETRDIVPWCLYVLKALGYEDADIDLAEWDRLHDVFVAAGQTYDETIDEGSTAKDRLNDALACGWAELTIKNGLVSLVRDEPRAAFDREYGPKTQTYSPQNMTKALTISGPMSSANDFDGVDVEYYSQATWAWETVQCRWPGDAGLKVEKVKLPGVGSKNQAFRFGMRRRGHQKYRQDTYSWETELAGMNSGYLSFCAVAGNMPGNCQSAQVEAVEPVAGGFIITSTEPLDWSAGGAHKIGFSRPDGTLSGPYPATQEDEYQVMIADLDFSPDTSMDINLPQILFGPNSKWAYPVLVTRSDPSDGNVSMKGMPYDDRVYLYDNSAPA
ncbi:host specificity factor TipJ family phage tail protein [Pseudomonas sp. R5(2019)]|uniref:host specificity factor TipJ family phage tail protein n=1 Tax=Pseudomonas sp. R5(2019) TaxID=2697566 RepID=UPI00141302A8|nr:host specificity factor TipJ family phage tail protein [Pseudomonas sp. R5(2019)]NBA95500.1 hypothetical protein [Pseudomonas sp. R5(2019)]